jgi:hypothetical protein
MAAWDPQLIATIAATDDLHIAPLRADGLTMGTPTWIWSVVVDGRLFVRAYNGRPSGWYQSAMTQHAGQITAAGRTIDVTFKPADPALQDRIDDAYRAKYAGDFYLGSMISKRAQAAAVEVTPRD